MSEIIAQGPVDVNVSQHCDCDHHETCEICVPSLYQPKAVGVQLTADGVNRIGDTIAELRMENAQLLAALEATSNAEQTKEAAAPELLAAAKKVNALSIQTEAHMELRAAIAKATEHDA